MKTTSQLLSDKDSTIRSIAPDASVYDAIAMMAEHQIGALLVMDGEHLAGIVSERDYARKVILKGRSSAETTVRDIMTPDVVCAGPDYVVDQCMAIMTEKKIRHLPVKDGDKVIGVLSLGDLVKSVIEEQQFTIEQLSSYIHG